MMAPFALMLRDAAMYACCTLAIQPAASADPLDRGADSDYSNDSNKNWWLQSLEACGLHGRAEQMTTWNYLHFDCDLRTPGVLCIVPWHHPESCSGIPGMVYPRPTVSPYSGIIGIGINIIKNNAAFTTTLQAFLCPWISWSVLNSPRPSTMPSSAPL
jgi:hypothetical protein